jgi:hypothetical protein
MSSLIFWRKTQPAAGTATTPGVLPDDVPVSTQDPMPFVPKTGGVAGTPAGDVQSVQGVSGGTAVNVAGFDATVTPTIAVSTSPAYTSGDVIGGKITLTSAVQVSGGASLLHAIQLVDRSNQKPTGNIIIFNADPSGSTLTDNAAVSIAAADALKVVSVIPIAASDWVTIDSKAFTTTLVGLGRKMKAASGTSLYAAFVTTSTPTFAATTDFQATFKFLPVNA